MKTLYETIENIFETTSPSIPIEINFSIKSQLFEGLDVDYAKKIVTLTDKHEDGVNTSLIDNPVYWDKFGCKGISIFKRNNEIDGDGNPLLYAIKNKYNWKLDISDKDIQKYLKRFISICDKIDGSFDSIIITPSSSSLNARFMKFLHQKLKTKNTISGIFSKPSISEAYEQINWDMVKIDFGDITKIGEKIKAYFNRMGKDWDYDDFSIKCIPPKYRKYLNHVVSIPQDLNINDIQDKINGRNILILDDTVSSGTTLSHSIDELLDMFTPKSVTVITLFSPIKD